MAEVKVIDVVDYPSQYADGEYVLVDVREADEYADGHLPGAVNVPLSTLKDNYEQIPTDKTVLLVCQMGGRSMRAAEFLQGTGKYDDLVNLDGGTLGWMDVGNAIEK